MEGGQDDKYCVRCHDASAFWSGSWQATASFLPSLAGSSPARRSARTAPRPTSPCSCLEILFGIQQTPFHAQRRMCHIFLFECLNRHRFPTRETQNSMGRQGIWLLLIHFTCNIVSDVTVLFTFFITYYMIKGSEGSNEQGLLHKSMIRIYNLEHLVHLVWAVCSS